MRTYWLSVLLLTLVASPALAEEDEDCGIPANRPGFTNPSQTVGRHHFQFEAGADYGYTNVRGGLEHSLRTPMQLRFGLVDRLEVYVELDGAAYDVTRTGAARKGEFGVSDLGVGLKWNFAKDLLPDLGPSLGVFASLGFPSGSGSFRGGLSPNLIFAQDWSLPWDLGLGSNLALSVPYENGKWTASSSFSVSVSRPWTPLSKRVSTYVEIFVEWSYDDGKQYAVLFDGGFVFQVNPHLQLDLYGVAGLAGQVPDAGVGGGFVVRY